MTPKRGRPALAADERHAERVTVALTAGQLARLQHAAAAAGAPASVTLRRLALAWIDEHAAADVPAPPPEPAPPAAEIARAVSGLSVQLARVGTNINQIARALNVDAGSMRKLLRGRRRDPEIAAALRETQALLEQIPPVLADVMEARR